MVQFFEVYQILSDFMTADLIVWHRYRQRSRGIVEKMLDANPQLSWGHRTSPFIPVGTLVRMPIDPGLLLGKPPQLPTDSLWTDAKGYSL
jgi:phage tail protein X